MLFIGFVIGFGLILIHIYLYIYSLLHPGETPATITIADSPLVISSDITMGQAFAGIGCCAVVIIIFALIAKIYNNRLRSIIVRLSHLFHCKIFTFEIVSTLIVWTISTLFFLITFPFISVFSLICLIINELLFVLAWGTYGQPDYKK